MDVGTKITEDMLERPARHADRWQRVVTESPRIAARFHETLVLLPEVTLTEEYYAEVAHLLATTGARTLAVHADLLVKLAEQALHTEDPYTARDLIYHHFKPYRAEERWRNTNPTFPIPADVAMFMLEQMSSHYAPFVHAAWIEKEDDLMLFVKTLLSTQARGKQRYKRGSLTDAQKKVARKLVTDNLHTIETPSTFYALDVAWINQAIFTQLSMEDRALTAKERGTGGVPLKGVALNVYAHVFVDKYDEGWILQSPHWDIKEKVQFLNSRYRDYRYTGQHLDSSGKWGWAQQYEDRRKPRVFYDATKQHMALLFPQPITLDFGSWLKNRGQLNLINYLIGAPLKIKVKMPPAELVAVSTRLGSTSLPPKKKEYVLKHFHGYQDIPADH